jgi:tellurite resistance protein TerC
MDWSFIAIVLQLIFLEGILSLDNAAVLGALVSVLPDDIPVTWPRVLRRVGNRLHVLLGNQRTAALRAGLLGAYLGRGFMLFLATLIIQNPWLKIVGAAYLIHLAFGTLSAGSEGEDEGAHMRQTRANSFWMIVLTVEMTDLIFSLDNVVAAVTLSSEFWVVMLGVAIGILMMRFAAGLFSYAVLREPILKNAAYLLVLNIGLELLYSEITGADINQWLRFGISIGTILLCLLYVRLPFRNVFDPFLNWIARGFSRINALVDWILEPFGAFMQLIIHGIRQLFSHLERPEKTTAQEPVFLDEGRDPPSAEKRR